MTTIEEKIETIKSRFISGNLLAIIWIIIGTVACWIVNPIFGWLFLAVATFSVYIIIRRFMCNSCYYCKSCTKGFTKMSILFLGASQIPGLSKGSILGMIVFTQIVLLVIPSLVLLNSILIEFTLLKLIMLISLLSVSTFAIAIRIRNRNNALWKHEVLL